jgi:protein-tyrosine phosphatase
MKILFVCTGNICRSPTAEGVMLAKVKNAGLADKIKLDSAGTHAYHVGEKPDSRSAKVAKKRGYDLNYIVSRKYDYADFYEFDLILCMDKGHHNFMQDLRPDNANAQVVLYLEYAGLGAKDVGDPYYGGQDGFEKVLDQIEAASDNILEMIKTNKVRKIA